jgi:SnoaL-like domain
MSDEWELVALVNSYALLLDAGDLDAVAGLFEYSTWRSEPHGTVLRGSREVRTVYEKLKVDDDGSPGTKHLLTNVSVHVDPGATSASSHCYWTVLQQVTASSGIDIILSGQYADRFEKVDGTWRFTDRLTTVDMTGDQSGHIG